MRSSREGSVNPAQSKRHMRALEGAVDRCKGGAVRQEVGDTQNTQASAIPGHPFPVAKIVVVRAAMARSKTQVPRVLGQGPCNKHAQ